MGGSGSGGGSGATRLYLRLCARLGAKVTQIAT